MVPAPPINEAERLDILYSCGILDTPRDERFDRVTRLAALFYDADVAFLGFMDDQYQWMKSVSAEGVAPWIERDRSVCQVVIASSEPLVVGDMQTDDRLKGHPIVPLLPYRFYAGVPLLTETGAAIASLCVLKREAQDPASVNLAALTDLAAIAVDELELWRRNRDLARLAETDGLTGLLNRRGFDAAIDRAVRQARRTRQPLSVMLLDLDHFKALNDALGHQVGDDVLRHFGMVLSAAAQRRDDVAARYGGEEFALILPNTDAAGAQEVARRLQSTLALASIFHPSGIDGLVTASVGIVSAAPDHLPEPEMLVAQADAALYRAKHAGRNRFATYV
jgi:diguanylate cyclase (GGDEF)-like protein